MNKSQFLLIFSILFSQYCFGQMAKGTWREHLPYNETTCIALNGNTVYCATPYSIFSYDQSDYSITKKSKIQGLSDLGVGYIAFSRKHNSLIVGYKNGNIDVIKDEVRYNFPDIKEKNIMYDKSVKHILIQNDTAFISTGFGIVVFNLAKMEIADTYFIGPEGVYETINGTIISHNNLYALTPNGIKRAPLNNPLLSDYHNWELILDLPYGNQNYITGAALKNKIVVGHQIPDSNLTPLSVFDGNVWSPFLADTITNLVNIRSNANNLWVNTNSDGIYVFDDSLNLTRKIGGMYNNDAMLEDEGVLVWLANKYSSLIRVYYGDYSSIQPNGPTNITGFEMKNAGTGIIVAPGGFVETGHNSGIRVNINSFTNEAWTNLSGKGNTMLDTIYDAVSIAAQNDPNHYFVGTWGFGLFEVQNSLVVNYYPSSENSFDKPAYVSGMSFDSKGNLWTVHRNTTEPFKVKTKDNKWYSYDFGMYLSGKTTGKVLYAKNGDFWTISHRGDGILVWNDNKTPENGADDEYQHFYALNEKEESLDRYYNCIAQDANGAMWIGTNNGVVVYDYPQNVLAGKTFYARTPQIVEEGYLKPLLKEKKVTSIAIDGGNRKWLGTEGGGLFLVSDDGTSELISFNQSSSPLFSDNIQSLCFNYENGELFIATDKGLQSYMTTSSGSRAEFSDVYAFPNPVRPDYSGFITIRGLMYNSNVKIVDLTGHLVFETTSEGGDAVWNGLDMEGSAVASGIYTVLLNNPDGSQSEATKILIIR